MISYSSKYRSTQEEIMDDFQLQGEELKSLLNDLKRVNTWLGGTNITLSGLDELLKGRSNSGNISIVDIGCGDGEILRKCADHLNTKKINYDLIGIDANEHILEEARKRSIGITNLSYQNIDVFEDGGSIPNFDIALCTLFLHHFKDQKILQLLKVLGERATIGIVINDLHRNKLAFSLFKMVSRIFLKTRTARHDGLVSVARAFKKKELIKLSQTIPGSHTINWKWAFRYQWIINTA